VQAVQRQQIIYGSKKIMELSTCKEHNKAVLEWFSQKIAEGTLTYYVPNKHSLLLGL
jgi:hypothetical protein